MLLQALCIISKPWMNSHWSYSPETLNSGQNLHFLSRVTLKFDGWPWKTTERLFYVVSSYVHHSIAISEFKLKLQSGNARIWVKIDVFLSRVTLKFDRWPSKILAHLFYATSSFVHHFVAIGEFKLGLQSGNAKFGSKSTTVLPCDLAIWQMTLKNNMTPLLSNIKLCVSFHHHMWIQTGVTVQKRLSWVLTSVTLTFDIDLLHGHYFCHW